MMERLVFECFVENKEEAIDRIKKVIRKEEPDVVIEEV